MAKSVYLKQVRSLAIRTVIYFRKNLGPRLGIKGRADTVNGTSRHSLYLLCLVRLKQTTPSDWLVRVHVDVSSSVNSSPHGQSFVPAESATLGIVDKSAFQHAICRDLLQLARHYFLITICSPVFTRVQTRESVSKVNLEIEHFVFAWITADNIFVTD